MRIGKSACPHYTFRTADSEVLQLHINQKHPQLFHEAFMWIDRKD